MMNNERWNKDLNNTRNDLKRHEGDTCPLCDSDNKVIKSQITYEAIWHELERECKTVFSEEAVKRHTPCEFTTLVECENCGLQYFIPVVPGDSQFYGELSKSPSFYDQSKWEFDHVLKRLRPSDQVLDVGCGEGSFLSKIRSHVNGAIGIDTNPVAVRRAIAAGLDVRLTDIFSFSHLYDEMFDVVCCFHVIEHINKVIPFIRDALSCLKPDGLLVLSVPNRERILCKPIEVLDCPPHHISRWSSDQLTKLGDMMGTKLATLVLEMADPSASSEWLRNILFAKIRNHPLLTNFQPVYLYAKLFSRIVFISPLHHIYKRTNLLKRWRLYRLTMLAYYKKQYLTSNNP
jgi:2-polyprenyl-3-methyl-5-hydroxy-6-metoxy-1,4-benzoquinol methylase